MAVDFHLIYLQHPYYTTIMCNFSVIILHFLILLGFQALGCLFYEIIALKPAFDANNLISLFYKIVKGDFDVSSMAMGTFNTNNPNFCPMLCTAKLGLNL